MADDPTRLVLVTPPRLDIARFQTTLAAVLDAVDVAAFILDLESADQEDWWAAAAALRPLVHRHDGAFLLRDRPDLVSPLGGDGIHVSTGSDAVKAAAARFRPDRIVGAGDCTTRHAAMVLGEEQPDYVFLGRLGHDEDVAATPTLVEWWTSLFEVPCVALATEGWSDLERLIDAGAEFVALRDLLWRAEDGPQAGARRAAALIDGVRENSA